MKIVVADDHPLTRTGLVQVLGALGPAVRCIEAADYAGTLEALREHSDADLALIDFNMPGMNGIASIEILVGNAPTVPLVVISSNDRPHDIRRAIETGVAGYILKNETTAVLLDALRLVLNGGTYVPPMLATTAAATELAALTGRQLDVLLRIAEGQSNKEICRALGLSEATVKTHVAALFRQLGVRNRTQAVRAAQAHGLLHGNR